MDIATTNKILSFVRPVNVIVSETEPEGLSHLAYVDKYQFTDENFDTNSESFRNIPFNYTGEGVAPEEVIICKIDSPLDTLLKTLALVDITDIYQPAHLSVDGLRVYRNPDASSLGFSFKDF